MFWGVVVVFAWMRAGSVHRRSIGVEKNRQKKIHRSGHWTFYYFLYFFSINVVFTWMEEMRFNALPWFGATCIWLQMLLREQDLNKQETCLSSFPLTTLRVLLLLTFYINHCISWSCSFTSHWLPHAVPVFYQYFLTRSSELWWHSKTYELEADLWRLWSIMHGCFPLFSLGMSIGFFSHSALIFLLSVPSSLSGCCFRVFYESAFMPMFPLFCF